MSISSLGSNSDLLQFLQSINQNKKTNATGGPSSLLQVLAQNNNSQQDGQTGPASLLSGHNGHHGLTPSLETAITSALQSSSNTTDPNQVIQQAITNLLSNSGQISTLGSVATNSTSSTTSTAATGTQDSQASFSQILQSFGVDPDQFHQDLQSAIQTSQQSGTSVDFASLFQNFPPGSVIDTIA